MWNCESCGEEIDDGFDSCWNCVEHQAQEEEGVTPEFAKKCISCGSEELIHGVKTVDRQILGSVQQSIQYTSETNGQKFVPRAASSPVEAAVCGHCGFVSFYATHFKAIRNAHLDSSFTPDV